VTAIAWGPLRTAYGWVHQAAYLLVNERGDAAELVRTRDPTWLETLANQRDALGARDHFRKVTTSYWPGLFHCDDVPDRPRTTNDREHFFGAARYPERRASGRKQASPTTVVRGAVRLVAAVATRLRPFPASELQRADPTTGWQLRQELSYRHEARRAQRRFRRDPETYLAKLEALLLKPALPS